MITEEEIKRIEETFKNRCIHVHNIKCGSKKFYDLQCEYFVGVMTALNIILPKWSIYIMSSRPIIEY